MKILIVDDHAIVRKGLIQIFADESATYIIGEAKNGNEALEKIREEEWDLIILDINLPGKSGLEVMTIIKDQNPKMPVLILSTFNEDQYAIRALKSGAAGYLNKQSAPEELVSAIKKIKKGEKYISPNQARLLLSSVVDKTNSTHLHENLSNRELEILIMIAKGNTLTDIATALSLSIRTISTYRFRLLQKLQLNNNAELISYALHNQLVE